jgi:ankyrin repeat protein
MLNVSDETDIDAQGGSFGNALQAACAQGNTKVVELLLDKGAVVDNECGFFGTALQAACYDGQKEIVDLLLSKNCNIDIEGGNFGSALQAASLQGHEHIVRTLLAKEAKVNSTGGEYWTALQAAASQVSSSLGFATETYISDARPLTSYAKTSPRHLSICKLLLKQKANVNAQHGGNHDTALEAAAYSGGEEIVQLLLEHKAEINGQAGDRHNPLQAAAYRGHSDIVQLLLRKGATIDDGEGVYGNALQAASFRNHASIVRDLLECQPPASISLKSRDGETALHWAAMFGDVELVKTLLTKGSNPVEPDAHGWTPVLLAWMYQRGSDAQKLIVDAAAKYSSEDFVGLPPTRLVKALECSGMSIEEDGVTASLGEKWDRSLRRSC